MKDVTGAREELNRQGARFGKVKVGEFALCGGRDPGNAVQLTNH